MTLGRQSTRLWQLTLLLTKIVKNYDGIWDSFKGPYYGRPQGTDRVLRSSQDATEDDIQYEETVEKAIALIEALEDIDDVQAVYHNLEM